MKPAVRSPQPAAPGVLVCFALKEEAAAFRRLATGRAELEILISGIGQQNARTAVGQVLAQAGPRCVFTCGFAGALNPALAVGDVVFETRDVALHTKLEGTGAKPVRFVCSSRVAVTTTDKAVLRRTTGADAVEMESEAIQTLCRARGIPCATVRVISDTANEDLPLDFNQLAKADLSLNYSKLALAIVKSPGKIPALLRLQKHSKLAAERLAGVLVQVI